METMGRTQRSRRSFSREFKAEVVELVRQPGNTAASVARDLDLTETAVRAWVKQADIDDGHRDGLTTAERPQRQQQGESGNHGGYCGVRRSMRPHRGVRAHHCLIHDLRVDRAVRRF